MEVASLVVGLLGLGFGVFATFRSFSLARQNLDLQRRMTLIEEARREEEVRRDLTADVTASFERLTLVILNRGPAMATDVQFENRTPAVTFSTEALSDALTLDGGQTIPVPLGRIDGVSVEIRLRWSDGRGPQVKDLRLPLPI